MTNFLTRSSSSLKNINHIKLFSKTNLNKSEKLLLKFKLTKGSLIQAQTQNIAILLNPIKSCYYDNKTTKAVLETAGFELIDELQDIKNLHLKEVKTSDVIITGVGNIERINLNIKNILNVIGKNEFNENNKIQCEEVLNHYKNLFFKLQEIEHNKITLPPLLELNYPSVNRKCAEIFFKEFLKNFIEAIINKENSNIQVNKGFEFMKNETVLNFFTFMGLLLGAIKKWKLRLSDMERIYYILKEEIDRYKEKKKRNEKLEKKVSVNEENFCEINMVIPEVNNELYEIYEKEFVPFLESLNLFSIQENVKDGSNGLDSFGYCKKYSAAVHKNLFVEISQK